MRKELMSLSVKSLGLGIIIGLIVGVAVGYAVTPKTDITPFEQLISDLEEQVTLLQEDIGNKSIKIADLQAQVSEKDSQISELQSEVETWSNQTMALQVQVTQRNTDIAALQNQVLQLESQLVELRQSISPYIEGEWNLVASFDEESGLTTDYFYVGGPELRLNWSWNSSLEEHAELSIYLYRQGETVITEQCKAREKQGTTFVHNIETAHYYLKIVEANLDQWNITVEVWIPD